MAALMIVKILYFRISYELIADCYTGIVSGVAGSEFACSKHYGH
jgi:hypothetical protein